MLAITILCVGRLKERFYTDACSEYLKRLSAYSKTEIIELKEGTPDEEKRIREAFPKGAILIALCIEGEQMKSEEFAGRISRWQVNGASRLCFIIGGSNGLPEAVKKLAQERLSLSEMTFPHNLARVVLLEQIYRAFQIIEGGKYHK
ncbi:MAG: 23S rRNA (pseudouridine(1915)-N(3))-methyltransferase RlmH [Bacillota bacterium]|nr:23S rRNA (pseudouridine(1915)-N(3))-methyltransferase RlmH [Bacillota bacterium]